MEDIQINSVQPISQRKAAKKLKQFLDMCSLKGITLAFVLENITVSADYSKLINEMETYKLASLELSEADWGELIDIYYQ